jgi:hypothetical protein
MKARSAGMHPGAFRNALKGNPDANRMGARMILENDPNTYQPKRTSKRRRNKK